MGPDVVKHLDQVLGIQEDQNAYSYKDEGFWVLEYKDKPSPNCISLVTIGLGRHLLKQESGGSIRQELIMTVWDEYSDFRPEEKVASLALDFLERHIPIPNHQVIPWEGGVFEGLEFSALYCTSARHMPEEFELIRGETDLIFVWLIPIYPEEQNYCINSGWSAFEELINDQQPDFFDLKRNKIKI